MSEYVSKNGLFYSQDLHTVYGIDKLSDSFTGRIPYGAHSIDEEAFSGCDLEDFSLPDSITAIGPRAFENSRALKKVKLPSQLTLLPPFLFAGCSNLEKVTMPNVIDGLSEGLFAGCSSLKDIPFRAGIKSLPVSVFEGCSSLKSLVIPATVERIESRAAADCTELMTVVLPANLQYLAEDAFEGCDSIHNIRLNGANEKFYVDEDGCLYENADEGAKLRLKAEKFQNDEVSFYSNDVENGKEEFFTDEGLFEEEDSSFSAEVTAEEFTENTESIENTETEEKTMDDSMNDTYEEIIAEQHQANLPTEVSINPDELEALFSKDSKNEQPQETVPEFADPKTKILLSSSKYSKIVDWETSGDPREDTELFVIAEKTVTDENNAESISPKLMKCCEKFARIQDFKKIIILSGLPADNDEFMQFLYPFMTQRNVVFACDATSPATLSEYARKICDSCRISLAKDALLDQRKKIGIKNNSLIKLVIQDLYN